MNNQTQNIIQARGTLTADEQTLLNSEISTEFSFYETFEDTEHSMNGDFQLWNIHTDFDFSFNNFNECYIEKRNRIRALYYCYDVADYYDTSYQINGNMLQTIERNDFNRDKRKEAKDSLKISIASDFVEWRTQPQTEFDIIMNDLDCLMQNKDLALIGTVHMYSKKCENEIYQVFFIGKNEKIYRYIIQKDKPYFFPDYSNYEKVTFSGKELIRIIKDYHEYVAYDNTDFQKGIKSVVEDFARTTHTDILYINEE